MKDKAWHHHLKNSSAKNLYLLDEWSKQEKSYTSRFIKRGIYKCWSLHHVFPNFFTFLIIARNESLLPNSEPYQFYIYLYTYIWFSYVISKVRFQLILTLKVMFLTQLLTKNSCNFKNNNMPASSFTPLNIVCWSLSATIMV